MALINCPECGRQVSDQAEKCPGCGTVINKKMTKKREKVSKKKGKKKLVVIVALIVVLLGAGAAGVFVYRSNVEKQKIAEQEKEQEKQKQEDAASLKSDTYTILCGVYDECNKILDSVSVAWKWAIFDSDDLNPSNNEIPAELSRVTGLKCELIISAFDTVYPDHNNSMFTYSYLGEPEYAVATIEQLYIAGGIHEEIDGLMQDAKANIQKIGESDASYEKLKEFYTAVENYMNFVYGPTCSYQELSAITSDYTSKIEECKTNLSFDIEK